MFRVHTPEQPAPSLAAEFDRLYLEKCQEVNRLEQEVDKYKNMVEIAVKQKAELRAQMDGQKALLEEQRKQLADMKQEALTADLISREEALKTVNAANSTIIVLPDMRADYLNDIVSQFDKRYSRALELIEAIPAVSSASTIRELAAEPLKGFIPDVEEPEELPEELLGELPEELLEELPLWQLQPTTSQDILCLSSALKNLHDIHKCDSFVLYTKLSRVLEKCIDQYSGED